MTKVVLSTRIRPGYDDLPEMYYHFPKNYLGRIESALNDWVVYYEPGRTGGSESRREGRMAYFAIARILNIREDNINKNHFYADVCDYMEFDHAVPFREQDFFYEGSLKKENGETNSIMFRNSVREISDQEYDLILRAGFSSVLINNEQDVEVPLSRFMEEKSDFRRPIIEQLIKRPFRDVAFRHNIRSAYDATCAMTGLKLINGGGRCEIEAAHIQPVGDDHNGPDSVRNGLALSRTVHWMFDRGLVSLNDDYEILLVEKAVPDPIKRMVNPNQKIILPENREFWPHPHFLQYHRENIFKG